MKLLLQGRQRLRYYPKLPCPSSQALDLNSEVKRKESGRWGPTVRSLEKEMATGSNTASEDFLKIYQQHILRPISPRHRYVPHGGAEVERQGDVIYISGAFFLGSGVSRRFAIKSNQP